MQAKHQSSPLTNAPVDGAIDRDAAVGLGAADTDLSALLSRAEAVRNQYWGQQVTYSPKVFIPLTTYCRDTCGYCTFVQAPHKPSARYLRPQEVLAIAEAGARVRCLEALFSLGEKPELRHAEARTDLAELGYERTIDYVRDMCAEVVAKTDLLPHANPGTLSVAELHLLKPVTASMGIMVENVSRRLLRKGMAHHACPDKVPVQRLRTLERAGEVGVPFTTGILIGIGETWAERVDSLLAIQAIHAQHGHIQEVIVQNFRAKPGIAMADHPEPTHEDMLRTLAVARLILSPQISLQAPPNLADHMTDYIRAGINDWGGVSPVTQDHINPERAWPSIERLRQATAAADCELHPRLTIYPRFLQQPDRFIAPEMRAAVAQRLAAREELSGPSRAHEAIRI